MRFLQCVFIVLLSGLLNSCGLVSTAYNNAPSLVSWLLDDYFDFSSAQSALLNPALITLHDWHRQTQLPQYVVMLQDLQLVLAHDESTGQEVRAQLATGQAPLTAEVACNKLDQIKASLTTLQLQSMPIILSMAPTISAQQRAYLQQKLAERTQKWKKQWWPESTEAQIAVRVDKAVDMAEKIYGGITAAQRGLLAASISGSAMQPALTYREILRRNDDIEQTILALQDSRLSPLQKSQRIQDSFARFQLSPNPVYAAYAEQQKQHTCEMIATLHQHTNAQQKLHAHNWLAGYINQFSALAATQTAAKS